MATIVLLNGTSSSGKTTIARAFQELAPRPFLNFSIDTILYTLPASTIAAAERGEPLRGVAYRDLVRAFYACVRELANLGHDLVVDHAIVNEREAALLQEAAAGHRLVAVGVECPLEVVTERERRRGDRRIGLAADQLTTIHRFVPYDLTIDSSQTEVEEAARRIVARL